MPHFDTRRAVYSSDIISYMIFSLGKLLHQPMLGAVSFRGTIPAILLKQIAPTVKVNAFISRLGLYGYNYSNITADGVLGRQKV